MSTTCVTAGQPDLIDNWQPKGGGVGKAGLHYLNKQAMFSSEQDINTHKT